MSSTAISILEVFILQTNGKWTLFYDLGIDQFQDIMSFEHPHIPDLEKNCKWIDMKYVADLSVDSIGDVTPHSLWATSDRTTLFSKLCSVFISNAKKVHTKYIVHKVHTNTNVNIFVSIAVINSSMICTNLHLRLSIKHNFIYLRLVL